MEPLRQSFVFGLNVLRSKRPTVPVMYRKPISCSGVIIPDLVVVAEPSHSRGAPDVPEPPHEELNISPDTIHGRNSFVPLDRHLYALVLKRIYE